MPLIATGSPYRGGRIGKSRKEPETGERGAEEDQRNATKERSERRVRHIAPSQMTGVIKSGKLVAMEPISAAREDVYREGGASDANQNGKIAGPADPFPRGDGFNLLEVCGGG